MLCWNQARLQTSVIVHPSNIRCHRTGNSLEKQWLRLPTLPGEGSSSIPGRGTKIPQAVQCGPKNKKDVIEQLWLTIHWNIQAKSWIVLGRGLFPYNYPEQISPTDFCLQTRLQATFFKDSEIPDLAFVMGATSRAGLQSYPHPWHTQVNEAGPVQGHFWGIHKNGPWGLEALGKGGKRDKRGLFRINSKNKGGLVLKSWLSS